MNLQRGFTRLTVAVSASVLALGVANDIRFAPALQTGIVAVLTDGRELSLAEMPPIERGQSETEAVARALSDQYKPLQVPAVFRSSTPSPRSAPDSFIPDSIQPKQIQKIVAIKHGVVQRVAWWWAHAEGSTLAVSVDAILWAVFFTGLWIARGFAAPRRNSR